jgi:alternate signal-mediated exported protein
MKGKRKIAPRVRDAVFAAVIAAALLTGGTYAWTQSQHKADTFAADGDALYKSVLLVESFEATDAWARDQELAKEVAVRNTGAAAVFARVQLKEFLEIDGLSLVPGVLRAAYSETDNHALHPTGECAYTARVWPGVGGVLRQYVEWTLGASVIPLDAWDGKSVGAWILDTTSAEGWAYWGRPIAPGELTASLLRSLTLVQEPDGAFYYALHVDMQAADASQLRAVFGGMPVSIRTALES